jgi:hypothetical protein
MTGLHHRQVGFGRCSARTVSPLLRDEDGSDNQRTAFASGRRGYRSAVQGFKGSRAEKTKVMACSKRIFCPLELSTKIHESDPITPLCTDIGRVNRNSAQDRAGSRGGRPAPIRRWRDITMSLERQNVLAGCL